MTAGAVGLRWLKSAAFLLASTGAAVAAEVIPRAPDAHFNDYANLVSAPTAAGLDQALERFERETSNQVLVAIYPTMQSDSSVEDYTVRVAQSWQAGLKGRSNGAVLFVFTDSHQIRIQVGYGLEGVLTDALCKRIISDEIVPRMRAGDFDGALTTGVDALMAATRGEYQGTGRTERDGARAWLRPVVILAVFLLILYARLHSSVYQGAGRGFASGMLMGMLLGGGGNSGGRGGGFGGGGFTGGGGSFGGGGAGGSW